MRASLSEVRTPSGSLTPAGGSLLRLHNPNITGLYYPARWLLLPLHQVQSIISQHETVDLGEALSIYSTPMGPPADRTPRAAWGV
jgi:hypothetical protein